MTEVAKPDTSTLSEASRKLSAADSPDLLSDCQIMLRFALKEGLSLPDDLRHDVAELDQELVKLELTPISAMPRELFAPETARAPGPTPTAGAASPPAPILPSELMLKVHGALSRCIAPATALTLQVSEPPAGRHRFLGGLPVLVKIASWVAVACAAGFVFTSLPAATEKVRNATESATPTPTPTPTPSPATAASAPPTPTPSPTPSAAVTSPAPAPPSPDLLAKQTAEYPTLDLIWNILKVLLPSFNAAFGAGLGAAFYILLSTQPYLTNRSFDPKYNAIYFCRFITGLIGGIILSIALGPLIAQRLGENGPYPITPGILAILGGYAAEAVQQILQRLVEVMLTAVRGDGSTQAQAKAAAAQTQQSAQMQKLLTDYERDTDPKKKQALLDQMHQLLVTPPANP
jgi:hypothetical protein